MACFFGQGKGGRDLSAEGKILYRATQKYQYSDILDWNRVNRSKLNLRMPDHLYEIVYDVAIRFSQLLEIQKYRDRDDVKA